MAGGLRLPQGLIQKCSQTVAQAFQTVQPQAEACGYKKLLLERNSLYKHK